MRSFVGIAAFALLAAWPAVAGELKGTVLENRVGGSPVPGVVISAQGANPNTTKADGQFKLVFPGKNPGSRVKVNVKKFGYVVINEGQLEQVLSIDPNEKPLMILICMGSIQEDMRRSYYGLKSNSEIIATYQLKELQSSSKEKLEQLQKDLDKANRVSEQIAEELAKEKLGQSSPFYKEAMRLFLDGRTDQALQVLDEEKLRRSRAEALEETAQAWVLRARFLILKFKFEDAERAYQEAMHTAPDSYSISFSYANFSQKLNHYSVAREAYDRSLELARQNRNDDNIAETLNNLGVLDRNQNRPYDAQQAFEASLKIYRELAKQYPSRYRHYLAGTLNNLGTVYRSLNRKDEAQRAFDGALNTYRELDDETRGAYKPEIAMILHNLGLMHRDQRQMDKAHQAFKEALKIRRELTDENPNAYLPDVAKTLNSLGALYYDQKQMGEARRAFEEALKIRRELANKNPDAYLPDVAEILSNLGVLHRLQKQTDEAQKAYEESLNIYREVANKNPDAYLPYVAGTLSNLGNLHRDQNRREEARQAYEEALKIYQRFAEIDPEQFRSKVARVEHLLEELGSSH